MAPKATAFRIGDTDTWAATIYPSQDETTIVSSSGPSPMAIHFVVDNSGSMGNLTREVTRVFSKLVDSAATRPCSLTLFHGDARVLSSNIMTTKEMIALPLPPQGGTNIPVGVKAAMKVITSKEQNEESRKLPAEQKTHHVLILLTDGHHNTGMGPNTEFPKIGLEAKSSIPHAQLSVVVVGITKNSSTSMGMLLKANLETVPLDTELVENIYFAASTTAMKTVTMKMVDGLNHVASGVMHTISSSQTDGKNLIPELGEAQEDTVRVRTTPNEPVIAMLLQSKSRPRELVVDGHTTPVTESKTMDYSLVVDIVARHIDKARIKRVASTTSAVTANAVGLLGQLIDALEHGLKQENDPNKLVLAKASAADRLAQHRKLVKTVHVARELRNQLADVANFSANCSQEQAAFLTGNQSKFASKALRRAAARRSIDDDGTVLDPKKEQDRIHNQLVKPSFAENLLDSLRTDTLTHLSRLTNEQRNILCNHIKASSESHQKILEKVLELPFIVKLAKEEKQSSTCAPVIDTVTSRTKVCTSALCWIPPKGNAFDSIQTVRQKYDKQINRWPPHINLLYPFVPSDDFDEAAKKLSIALRDVNAFDVTLSDIKNFSHGKSCTAWLGPDEKDELIALQTACQAVFPHCDDLSSRGFVPHLTVGQCKSETAAKALIREVKWEPSMANCGEVCLISREGKNEPFKIQWRVKLGEDCCVKGPPTADEGGRLHSKGVNGNGVMTGAPAEVRDFIDSGALSGYLNDVFFGGRVSYLSQMSPWEHIQEWCHLSKNSEGFESLWEMLLYVGSLAYPLVVARNAASQMNPFKLEVKNVHASLVDTASLSCANNSEIATYGPEGGEPIQDALVLTDPSLPASSYKISSTLLLGESYTSTVVSRDLHMYTGSSMKVALLAKSLFRCLQPETEKKSRSDVIADIRRQFQNTYQCAACGTGPVDHGGCSDLFSHHGEVDDRGGTASNSCSVCGWFSEDLNEWDPWDGTVPESLLSDRMDKSSGPDCSKPLAAKMDLVLRILYSFRKTFANPSNPIRTWYGNLARKMVEWDLTFTTQDEVDDVVQVLIAIMACDDDIVGTNSDIEAAFSPPVALSLINEACAREARKQLSMVSGGDDAKAKSRAIKVVTKLLGVTDESAPDTTDSLLEPEPNRSDVLDGCSRDYCIKEEAGTQFLSLVSNISSAWCKAFSLARALRVSIAMRGGGWRRLERDMETSLDNYADVVQDLQNTTIDSFLEMCDISEAEGSRTLATMAAQAHLYTKGSQRQNLPDVRCNETISNLARDMRMNIYERRVGEKMAQWKSVGEELAFMKARAADIGQYADMVNATTHVHAMSKEMFWALWEAAVYDGSGGEKVRTFLETANQSFCYKYGPIVGGKALSRKQARTKSSKTKSNR